jgi:hypothetical protein
MLEASWRGTATNANTSYQQWDAKDGLEYTLRAYEAYSGHTVKRPRTTVGLGREALYHITRLRQQGKDSIVKPAHGGLGRGIRTYQANGVTATRRLPRMQYVVQEVVQSPLLIRGRKADARVHALIDPENRARSRWIAPVLLRIGGVPYVPGRADAENLNYSYQRSHGLRPTIAPLSSIDGISGDRREEIREATRMLVTELIDAFFWFGRSFPRVPNRVFLWGIDAALVDTRNMVSALLLENNIRPQLYRGEPSCDRAMEDLLRDAHLGALLSRQKVAERRNNRASRCRQ